VKRLLYNSSIAALLGLLLCSSAGAQELGEKPTRTEEDTPPSPLPITKAPTVKNFVEAVYPEGAKAQGIEGTVGLVLQIDETGKVIDVKVGQEANYGFDEAAIKAVEQMLFSPAEDANGPVAATIEFEYRFALSPEDKATDLPPINLDGIVRRMGDRTPIQGANVRVSANGITYEAVTDDAGFYSIRGLPPGMVFAEADAPGHKPQRESFKIRDGKVTTVQLWLKPNVSINEAMVIEADRPEPDISRRTVTVREIKRIPGTFGDPVRVIQNLPGTARAPFGTGLVVVRGSNPEDTAFYVDGIRVPLIYHLGGLVSIVNDDLVGSVEYLPGGYGVEFGRSTGGVINIKTNQDYPERFRAEISLDLLDGSAVVQGRVGKKRRWGLTAAGRRSWLDVFLTPLAGGEGFTVKPYWWDYQVKLDDLEKADGKFSVLLMGFGDKLFFGSPADFAQGSDQDTQGDADVFYGAQRLIAQYNQQVNDDLTVRVTPALGYDSVGFSLGDSYIFDTWSWVFELRSDALWEAADWVTVRPGIDIIGGPYEIGIETPMSPEMLQSLDPIQEREPFRRVFDGTFWAMDPFIEAWIKPIDGTDKLKLVPGLRFNTLTLPQYNIFSIDPRFAVRYSPFEGTTFKAGTGLYHQPPQGADLGFNETDIRVDYERSWATEFGVEQQFGDAIETDLTFFHKTLTELIVENENLESESDPFFVNGGEGRVRGMEVMIRHNPVGNFFGWISYTLSSAERYAVPLSDDRRRTRPTEAEEWRPFEYDQTHILVALAGYDLPKDWGVSGRFRYVTGNPTTPLEGGLYDIDRDLYYPTQSGGGLSERLPPFYALDLRVDKRWTFKRWWLETYLDLLNVARGENPEAREYNYDYTESTYIRGLPFIPSIGLRAEYAF